MTYQIHQRDAELRGEAKGREEGEKKGRAEGRAEGEKKGRAEGEEKKAQETAQNLYTMGMAVEKIAAAVGYAADTVRSWLSVQPA